MKTPRRQASQKALLVPPFTSALPSPIFFRAAHVPADAAYPQHSHSWGEFVYSFRGLMEVRIGDRHYLAPPHYGIWLPPDLEHQGLNQQEAEHCSLYVSAPRASALPASACALTVSPLLRALLDHLRLHPTTAPVSEAHMRLLQVVVDQLQEASVSGSYLPTSTDPLLEPVLTLLQQNPADNRPLAALAALVHASERTLVRRAQQELGMSLADWRQRLRVVRAMPMLEAGEKVESIALDLGYASASAFIAMFRRLMGVTPDEYRKSLTG
ncbi:helix-turn-helix domain-containing protein [Thalassolituus sp. LLYu03]|uniref:AraC family ligand binding domain-containing protein n=1 Tax=Thalassolituus sp. LLYu03 TaxID=3421656 RepID=UPI003D2A31B0